MKGTLTVLCAGLAFSWAAIAGAQGYGSGQSTSGQSESRSHSKMSREVTLTGCLEQGSSPDTYVLRNATHEEGSSSMSRSSGSSSSSSGSEGTSGQMGSSMSGNESPMDFQLVAGRSAKDLKKYVGQRVQVKGMVEPMEEREHSGMSSGSGSGMSGSEGTSGSSGSGMSGGSSGQSGSSSGGSMSGSQGSSAGITHRLKVSSVKSLGSSCQ